jgi:hypothetical protein
MCIIPVPFCRICRIVQANGQVSLKRICMPVANNNTTKYFSLQISLMLMDLCVTEMFPEG